MDFPAVAARSSKGDVLAVGDATGRILLWRGVLAALESRLSVGTTGEPGCSEVDAAEQISARATVHWHAEPVCCMAFSPDDAFLLSGAVAQAVGSIACWGYLQVTIALPAGNARRCFKLVQVDMKACWWSGTFRMAGGPTCLA